MDRVTAFVVSLAILCATAITVLAIFKLTTQATPAKEIAILAITAIFSAISGGGVGYTVGKVASTSTTEGKP